MLSAPSLTAARPADGVRLDLREALTAEGCLEYSALDDPQPDRRA
ncbi:hypothetical protein [Saccharothrix deserti]|nr:hypothetical protein [Saccharothrix deserti]